MNRFKILLVISVSLFLLIPDIYAFYLNFDSDDGPKDNLLKSFKINHRSFRSTDKFPDEFSVQFSYNDNEHLIEFLRNIEAHPSQQIGVYQTENGKVTKLDLNENAQGSVVYSQKGGGSYATLIRNKRGTSEENKFRAIVSVDGVFNDGVYDIMPVNLASKKRKRRDSASFDSASNHHAIFKRKAQQSIIDEPVKLDTMKLIQKKSTNRQKRSNNGQPFNLTVECLLVVDSTVYNNHVTYAGTSDSNLVNLYLRAYLAHFMNGVNQRYQNSLSTDADLRINIRFTNMLVITTDVVWSNPATVGVSGYPTYNGVPVINSLSALNAFRSYMLNQTLPFTFDHAVGMTRNDLWSGSGTPDVQTGTLGKAFLSAICTDASYSVVEEDGGFAYVTVVSHEIGHSLGAVHDGDPTSASCPTTDNYIMTPILGANPSNLINIFKFSSCSVNLFKGLLLTNNFNTLAQQASCLTNSVATTPNDVYVGSFLPGQFFTPDDQCKMIYGNGSSFCRFYSNSMCTSLSCRVSSTNSTCIYVPGIGAAEGTTCDSGKMCLQGVCSTSAAVATSDCPFGDDVVDNNKLLVLEDLPTPQMSCETAINYISSLGRSPIAYCLTPNFGRACCASCKRYQTMACYDKYVNCYTLKASCTTLVINGQLVKDACPMTCGTCTSSSQLTCANSTFLCQNGGTCANITVPATQVTAFKCNCPVGFNGYFCEQKNPCAPNPCQNNGVCQQFGSNGYVCLCPAGCTGYNCSSCSSTNLCAGFCQNGGLCSLVNASPTCACLVGFSGTQCQTAAQKNDCNSNPCQSGFTCVSLSTGGYRCICVTESCLSVTTTTTTTAIAPNSTTTSTTTTSTTTTVSTTSGSASTAITPALNTTSLSSTTTTASSTTSQNLSSTISTASTTRTFSRNVCIPNPCLNSGRCVQTGESSAICQCQPNFTGFTCERGSPCASNPCLNNGTCMAIVETNLVARYTCTCRIPFSGTNCELNSNPQCTSTTCLNGGSCFSNGGSVFCSCPVGYGGTNCQTFTFTTTLAPTTRFSLCVDKGSFCPGVASLCNRDLTVGGTEPLRTYCSFTCGLCSTSAVTATTTTTSSVTCLDKGTFCPTVTNLCNSGLTVSGTESLRTYCSKSCGACSGGGGVTVTPIGTTTTTTTQTSSTCVDSQTSCPSFANSCNVFLNAAVRIRDVCKRTCGNC